MIDSRSEHEDIETEDIEAVGDRHLEPDDQHD